MWRGRAEGGGSPGIVASAAVKAGGAEVFIGRRTQASVLHAYNHLRTCWQPEFVPAKQSKSLRRFRKRGKLTAATVGCGLIRNSFSGGTGTRPLEPV